MMGRASHRHRIISSAAWAVALAVLALCAVTMIDERAGGEHSLAATDRSDEGATAEAEMDAALDASSAVSTFYTPRHDSMSSTARGSGISGGDDISDVGGGTSESRSESSPISQLTEEETSGAYWEKAFSDDLDVQAPTAPRQIGRELSASLTSDLDDAVKDAVDAELSDAPTTVAQAIGERERHRSLLRGFSWTQQPQQQQRDDVKDYHYPYDAAPFRLRPHPMARVRTTSGVEPVSFGETSLGLAPAKKDRQKEVSAAVTEAQSALQKAASDKKAVLRATKIAQKVVATELVRAKKIQKEVETNPKAVKRVKKVVKETKAEVELVKRQMSRATADLEKQLGRVNRAAVVTKGTHAEHATRTKQSKVKKMAQAIKSASLVPGAASSPAAKKKHVAKLRKQLKHVARHIVEAQARKYAIEKHASRVARQIKAVRVSKHKGKAAPLSKAQRLKLAKLKQKLKNLRKRRRAVKAKVKTLKAGKVALKGKAHETTKTKTNHAEAARAAAKAKATAQFDRLASPQSKAKNKFLLAKAKATHDQTEAERAREHAKSLARQAEAAAHKLHAALVKLGHK